MRQIFSQDGALVPLAEDQQRSRSSGRLAYRRRRSPKPIEYLSGSPAPGSAVETSGLLQAHSGALIEGGENQFQVGLESGQLVSGGGVQDFEVNRPVAVDDAVPQPDRLLPRDLREPGLDVVGELACGFAEHGEVPQQSVAALAVGFQVTDG